MYRKYFKRLLDILFSIILLILLSPLMSIVSVLIILFMGWPIIFMQDRPGLNEKPFKILKFRSMAIASNNQSELTSDSSRITALGTILRMTSIDELPELINILKGDMSFVGPRPLLTSYIPYYTEAERIRHKVRPGLTGLAQINGRNYLKWDERLKLDQEYVNCISFKLDFRIIARTIINTLKMSGIEPLTSETEGNLAELRKNKQNTKSAELKQ